MRAELNKEEMSRCYIAKFQNDVAHFFEISSVGMAAAACYSQGIITFDTVHAIAEHQVDYKQMYLNKILEVIRKKINDNS